MLRHLPRTVQRVWWTTLACGLGLTGGCERTPDSTGPETAGKSARVALSLRPETIGAKPAATPWIAHVLAVDLDRDGRLDIIACEAQANQVLWLQQTPSGSFEERVIAKEDDIDRKLTELIRREQGVSDEVLEALKKQYGFDKPVHVRYLLWLKNLLGGKPGRD